MSVGMLDVASPASAATASTRKPIRVDAAMVPSAPRASVPPWLRFLMKVPFIGQITHEGRLHQQLNG
jgi:hypothetical protein